MGPKGKRVLNLCYAKSQPPNFSSDHLISAPQVLQIARFDCDLWFETRIANHKGLETVWTTPERSMMMWLDAQEISIAILLAIWTLTLQPLLFFGKSKGSPEKSKGFSLRWTPTVLGKERKNAQKSKENGKTQKARKKRILGSGNRGSRQKLGKLKLQSELPETVNCQRKTKGQQLQGKVVSALFHTFWHFSAHFHTFRVFQNFPPGLFRRIKGFRYCCSSKRRQEKIKESKKKKSKPFCTLVVARLSSSKIIDLLMGLPRGTVFHHGGVPENSPLTLMGCFPSLMGRFPTLMGRFPDCLTQRAPGLKKINLERQYWQNQAFNTEWNSQSRMVFSFWAPLWPQKNRAWDWDFSIENEIFKPRMKISIKNEHLVRGGMFFFHAFEREWIFSIPGPSGKWAVFPLENPLENSPLRKGRLRGSWISISFPFQGIEGSAERRILAFVGLSLA